MQQIEIHVDDLLFVSDDEHHLIAGMPVRVTTVTPGLVQAVDSNGNKRIFNRYLFSFRKAKELPCQNKDSK